MIRFTQFKRPSGEPAAIEIKRSEAIEQQAADLELMGIRFEAEILGNGQVVLYAEDPRLAEGPLAMVICDNNEQVPIAVDVLIARARLELKGGIQ